MHDSPLCRRSAGRHAVARGWRLERRNNLAHIIETRAAIAGCDRNVTASSKLNVYMPVSKINDLALL